MNFCALCGSDLYGVLAVNGWFGLGGFDPGLVVVVGAVVLDGAGAKLNVDDVEEGAGAGAAAEEGVAKLKVEVVDGAGAVVAPGAGVVVDPNENDDPPIVAGAAEVALAAVAPAVNVAGAGAGVALDGVAPKENPPVPPVGAAVEGAGVLPKLNAMIDESFSEIDRFVVGICCWLWLLSIDNKRGW